MIYVNKGFDNLKFCKWFFLNLDRKVLEILLVMLED